MEKHDAYRQSKAKLSHTGSLSLPFHTLLPLFIVLLWTAKVWLIISILLSEWRKIGRMLLGGCGSSYAASSAATSRWCRRSIVSWGRCIGSSSNGKTLSTHL